MTPNPSATLYPAVEQILQKTGALLDAAETHGVLCGFLCAAPIAEDQSWLAHVLGETGADRQLAEDSRRTLARLKDYVDEQLRESEMGFNLLLPPDNSPLAGRLAALAGWCEGFLFGFGLGSYKNIQQLSPEGQEFVRDVVSFSRLDSAAEQNETSEHAYMELVEYLRVGVMALYEEQPRHTETYAKE